MALCARDGCTRAATHAPRLNVPAVGWAIDLHQPIQLLVGIELCRDHAVAFLADFKWCENPQIKSAVETAARGKMPPDFNRSFVEAVRLDSAAYQKFKSMGRHGPT